MTKYHSKIFKIVLVLSISGLLQSCETSYISSPVETPNRVLQKSTTVTKSVIYTNPADPAIALLMLDSVRYFKLYGPKGFNGIAQYINAYEFVDQNDTTQNFSVVLSGHKVTSMHTNEGSVSFRYPDDTTFICIFNNGDTIAPFVLHHPPESTSIPIPGKDYGDDIREASSVTNWPKIRASVNGELQGFGSRPADDAGVTIEFQQNGFVVGSGIMHTSPFTEGYFEAPVPIDVGVTPYPYGSIEAINSTISFLQATVTVLCGDQGATGIAPALETFCPLLALTGQLELVPLCTRIVAGLNFMCESGWGDNLKEILDLLKVDPDAGFYNHIDPTATFTIKVNSPRYGKSECGPFLVSDYVNGGVVSCQLPVEYPFAPVLTISDVLYEFSGVSQSGNPFDYYTMNLNILDLDSFNSNPWIIYSYDGCGNLDAWSVFSTKSTHGLFNSSNCPLQASFQMYYTVGSEGKLGPLINIPLPSTLPH